LEKHVDTVAQTSRLLEVIALPKIEIIKRMQRVLDIGCGEGE
jgi:cyclopropane fatty-acyl-phospholipid synthase-like methyltransferase